MPKYTCLNPEYVCLTPETSKLRWPLKYATPGTEERVGYYVLSDSLGKTFVMHEDEIAVLAEVAKKAKEARC